MSDKVKFPRAVALRAAREICLLMADDCSRLECAGSLRRGKAEVGDVEILYVPLWHTVPDGLFGVRGVNLADETLGALLAAGVIAKRKNKLGSEAWGEKNKLALHVATGCPVDFFSTSEPCWWNYLVCRTGGKLSNVAIATAARRRGLLWHPYGPGFTDASGGWITVKSEAEVFACAGLPYLEPERRH